MARFTIEIEVYSDLICAWCYIGKRALDKAIHLYKTEHPDVEFRLTWKPYMLWPNAGVSAYRKWAILEHIFGPRALSIRSRIDQLGERYGISFRWEGRSGNTRDAHKLILLAMERDAAAALPNGMSALFHNNNNNNIITTLQQRTIDHLFALNFERGADISSRAVLAAAAVDLGLCATEAEALAYLSQDDPDGARRGGGGGGRGGPAAAVDESSARARRIGVRAVPSYVVQGRCQVGGMQSEDVWLDVFERARTGGVAGNGAGSGRGPNRTGLM